MKYIALLRGINVSGQKLIKMAELRVQLEEVGLQNVQTYIQSGNVVFESNEEDVLKLEQIIANKIKADYDFEVPVMVKDADDLKKAQKNNPYTKDDTRDPKKVYVAFLSEKPRQERMDVLAEVDFGSEEYELIGTHFFMHSPNGAGRSKMSNNLIENKLKVTSTTRNLNTIQKLIDMAKS